jgi:hypothetical protein
MVSVAEQTVRGPDGRIWEVGRVWFHRTPRWNKPKKGDGVDGATKAEFGLEAASTAAEAPAALVIVVVLVVLALAWAFIFPVLIFLLDLLLIALIAGVTVLVRVLFRRPWKVVAETNDPPAERVEIPVFGYRAAGAKVDEIAYQIQETGTPFRA